MAPLLYPRCGVEMVVVAVITDPAVVDRKRVGVRSGKAGAGLKAGIQAPVR